jgi:hypothetical protein
LEDGMKKTCTWLIAMSCLLALAGTTYAGAPTMTLLVLPQLFGQEPGRDLPKLLPGAGAAWQGGPNGTTRANPPIVLTPQTLDDDDDDVFLELLDEGVNLLLGRTCQWVSQILLPYPPCNLAVDAVAGYLSVMEAKAAAASMAAENTNAAAGGGLGAEPISPPATPQAGNFKIGAGYNRDNGVAQTCPSAVCPNSTPADAWFSSGCCEAVKKIASSTKACKCCEDCKDCACDKQAAGSGLHIQGHPVIRGFGDTQGGITSGIYVIEQTPMPGTAPNLQPYSTIPVMMQMVTPHCGPELLHYPQVVSFGPCPMAQQPLHDVPLYPVEALQELIQQRQAITHAIEQIERELMQMAIAKQQQQQATVMQATHNAQKVHLATEFFEAHCDTLRSVGENVMVLEGDVRLTSKKGGHPIRIEAARVRVNMQDGTFKVESATTFGTVSAPTPVMERVQMVPAPPWAAPAPMPNSLYFNNPPVYVPLPPPCPSVPQDWQPVPYRLTPGMPLPPQ